MNLPFQFYRPAPFPRLRVEISLFEARGCAGFPSPAEGYAQRPIDLNELSITNPPAMFLLRMDGDSMKAGSLDGEESISHQNGFVAWQFLGPYPGTDAGTEVYVASQNVSLYVRGVMVGSAADANVIKFCRSSTTGTASIRVCLSGTSSISITQW